MSDGRWEREFITRLTERTNNPTLIQRAPGSMGRADVLAVWTNQDRMTMTQPPSAAYQHRAIAFEVKATRRTLENGAAVIYLTENNKKGIEQRDELRELSRQGVPSYFAVRQIARSLPEGVPRWGLHLVGSDCPGSVLRQGDATCLGDWVPPFGKESDTDG